MTRYLLDTNIISEATRPDPSFALLQWMGEQVDTDPFISSLSLAEIRRGILEKTPGRKRDALELWFDGADGPLTLFSGRILPFDSAAALVWARIMAEGRALGSPRSALDMIVAAIALDKGCVVATANERHFRGIANYINPMTIQ